VSCRFLAASTRKEKRKDGGSTRKKRDKRESLHARCVTYADGGKGRRRGRTRWKKGSRGEGGGEVGRELVFFRRCPKKGESAVRFMKEGKEGIRPYFSDNPKSFHYRIGRRGGEGTPQEQNLPSSKQDQKKKARCSNSFQSPPGGVDEREKKERKRRRGDEDHFNSEFSLRRKQTPLGGKGRGKGIGEANSASAFQKKRRERGGVANGQVLFFPLSLAETHEAREKKRKRNGRGGKRVSIPARHSRISNCSNINKKKKKKERDGGSSKRGERVENADHSLTFYLPGVGERRFRNTEKERKGKGSLHGIVLSSYWESGKRGKGGKGNKGSGDPQKEREGERRIPLFLLFFILLLSAPWPKQARDDREGRRRGGG